KDAISAGETYGRMLEDRRQIERLIVPNSCIVTDRENGHVRKAGNHLEQGKRLIGLDDRWSPGEGGEVVDDREAFPQQRVGQWPDLRSEDGDVMAAPAQAMGSLERNDFRAAAIN